MAATVTVSVATAVAIAANVLALARRLLSFPALALLFLSLRPLVVGVAADVLALCRLEPW